MHVKRTAALITFSALLALSGAWLSATPVSAAAGPADHPDLSVVVDTEMLRVPYRSDGGWWAGNTHIHTVSHTEPGTTPSALTVDRTGRLYRDLGFDFLVITDHDSVTPLPDLDGFTFVSGVEVSTVREGYRPHLIGVNVTSAPAWWALDDQGVIDDVASQDGLAILAHPNVMRADRTRLAWTTEEAAALDHYAGIEVYNHIVAHNARGANRPWALEQWFAALSAGREVWGFAVDDHHKDDPYGHGYIVVQAADQSPEALVDAMASGRFLSVYSPVAGRPGVWPASFSVVGETVRVETLPDRPAVTAVVYDATGTPRLVTEARSFEYAAAGDEGFLVVALWGADGSQVWFQPIGVGDVAPDLAAKGDPWVPDVRPLATTRGWSPLAVAVAAAAVAIVVALFVAARLQPR